MNSTLTLIMYMAIIVAFIYLFMIRPGAKRVRDQQAIMNTLQPGTRVMLTSGIFGTVQAIGERQLVVELAPGVEITCLKQVINKVLTPDDEEFEYTDGEEGVDEQFADLIDPQDAPPAVHEDVVSGTDAPSEPPADWTVRPDTEQK